MCGRYSLTRRQEELIERFNIEELLCDRAELKPRFNIAPSQMVPVVVVLDGKRVLTNFKWGFIPHWVKDLSQMKPVINARSETLFTKPFFRHAIKNQRCLIPADGFYEWKHQDKVKVPMYIHNQQRTLFAFAGLWSEYTTEDGEVMRTCSIVTTAANNKMSSVHDRMPVILTPDQEAVWLDPKASGADALSHIFEPCADSDIDMYAVSPKVNSAAKDLPEMIEPAPVQTSLF